MKLLICAILFLLSLSTSGQDCGVLLDGETVRLDQPGKSLEKAKVQDQDGLGTCYANTNSLMLKSALPGNPDVSYLNIAALNAEKINSQFENSSFAYGKDGDFLMDGGHLCSSFDLLKKAGGVCSRSDVPLEKSLFNTDVDNFVDNAHVQKELIEKVSRYFDNVNKSFNKRSSQTKGIKLNEPLPKSATEVIMKAHQGIENGVSWITEKAKSFYSELRNGFKNFFGAIFDRGAKENRRFTPGPVISKKLFEEKVEPITPQNLSPSVVVLEENSTPVQTPMETPSKVEITEQVSEIPVLEGFSLEKYNALKNSKKELSKKEQYQMALYDLLQKRMPEYTAENCQKPDSKNGMEVLNNFTAYVENALKDPKYDSSARLFKHELYKNLYSRGEGKTLTYEFQFKKEVLNAINVDYLQMLSNSPKAQSGAEAFSKSLKKNLSAFIKEEDITRILNRLDPNVTELLEKDYKRYALGDKSDCLKDQSSYLRNQDGLIKDFTDSPCLKNYLELGKGIQELAIGLEKRKFTDIKKIADFILNSPDNNYEKSLMLLLAPTCTDDKKIKIPEKLDCKANSISFEGHSTNKMADLNKKLEKEKTDFRNNVFNSISDNKVVGVTLCTIFFKENPEYFYNLSNSCKIDNKSALHVTSIIGYRCKAGKLDYLIQNSWGEWRNLNPQHERDSSFGKAWFSEESIVKNTSEYSILKNSN